MPSIPFTIEPFTAVTGAIWITSLFLAWVFLLKEPRKEKKNRQEYRATGLTSDRVTKLEFALSQLELSEAQLAWVHASLFSEIQNQIVLAVRSRSKSILFLKIVRSVPLVAGLLTAGAGQLGSQEKNIALFLVNCLMVLTSISLELSRSERYSNLWYISRVTANLLLGEAGRFLAGSLKEGDATAPDFDHSLEFRGFVDRCEKILNLSDVQMAQLMALDLESVPEEKTKDKPVQDEC
jgi:hypothetical protein